MKLFIKNTIPWSNIEARWEIRDTNGVIGEFTNRPFYLQGHVLKITLNGTLSVGNNAPVEITTEMPQVSLGSLFSKKKMEEMSRDYPYKFYEANEPVGQGAQLVQKMELRVGGFYYIRCEYKGDVYTSYEVPVASDDIQIYVYKNDVTVGVFKSEPIVENGEVEYYLYTRDDKDLVGLMLSLLCYDMHYYKDITARNNSVSYPKHYKKRNDQNILELIRKMDPQFINPLEEQHKNDVFM